MRRMLNKSIYITILILLGFIFYSCVEEPVMEPSKIPYTSVRVGNFTNLSSLTMTIDGKNNSNIAQNSLTNYFDVTSGERKFVILGPTGDTVYNKNITMNSYAELNVCFLGSYDSSKNLVEPFTTSDGMVYLLEKPGADSVWFHLINLIKALSTQDGAASTALTYTLSIVDTINNVDTTVTITHSTSTKTDRASRRGFAYKAGDYQVSALLNATSKADTVNGTATAGMKYYIFVTGDLQNVKIVVDEQFPRPLRPQS